MTIPALSPEVTPRTLEVRNVAIDGAALIALDVLDGPAGHLASVLIAPADALTLAESLRQSALGREVRHRLRKVPPAARELASAHGVAVGRFEMSSPIRGRLLETLLAGTTKPSVQYGRLTLTCLTCAARYRLAFNGGRLPPGWDACPVCRPGERSGWYRVL